MRGSWLRSSSRSSSLLSVRWARRRKAGDGDGEGDTLCGRDALEGVSENNTFEEEDEDETEEVEMVVEEEEGGALAGVLETRDRELIVLL